MGNRRTTTGIATVALIGNPNTGKSTLFNRLTGSRQRIGNYPGVTVAKKSGRMVLDGREINVLDLPGAYSLAASSPDERISSDVLSGRGEDVPDLTICVVDSRQLARSLQLACQIADLGVPLIIALNFMDEVTASGQSVNAALLSQRLGVPVIPISARKGQGLEGLYRAIGECLETPVFLRTPQWPECVQEATRVLKDGLKTNIHLSDAELRRIVFDHRSAYLDLVGCPESERKQVVQSARAPIREAGFDPYSIEMVVFQKFISELMEGVTRADNHAQIQMTGRIDSILTHRFFGLLIFAGLMFVVFEAIYTLSGPAMDLIETLFSWLGEVVGNFLAPVPVFQSLVCDGIIAGAGGVVVFLPQIFLLFFFVSLLEDTGYMARAAFLMDKLFGWCGLNGKSFVPLLSSYACAVPGIFATRTIENPRARLVTVLVAPLMSCSARLPVYLLLIGAFIEPVWGVWAASLTLFAAQMLGLFVALPLAWVVNRFIFKTPNQPFIMEMPPYRFPVPKDVLWRMWMGGKEFLQRAGTIIVVISVIIWALLYFPHKQGAHDEGADPVVQAEQIEQSFLGRAGHTLQPIFAPAGFDWKITVGVLASFPAREVIVSTLGIIYRLGGDVEDSDGALADALRAERWQDGPHKGQPVFTLPVALAIMVFFAFCMQCSSTLVVIAREVGARYAVLTFVYMTTLAWVAAVVVYQTTSLFL